MVAVASPDLAGIGASGERGRRLASGIIGDGAMGAQKQRGAARSKAGGRAHPFEVSAEARMDGVDGGVDRGGRRSSGELELVEVGHDRGNWHVCQAARSVLGTVQCSVELDGERGHDDCGSRRR